MRLHSKSSDAAARVARLLVCRMLMLRATDDSACKQRAPPHPCQVDELRHPLCCIVLVMTQHLTLPLYTQQLQQSACVPGVLARQDVCCLQDVAGSHSDVLKIAYSKSLINRTRVETQPLNLQPSSLLYVTT